MARAIKGHVIEPYFDVCDYCGVTARELEDTGRIGGPCPARRQPFWWAGSVATALAALFFCGVPLAHMMAGVPFYIWFVGFLTALGAFIEWALIG